MSLEIKHVADLMGMNFRIPSYQRGYRWERKQIEQLLNDLAEFSQSLRLAKVQDRNNELSNKKNPSGQQKPVDNERNIGYYCLQPLAITEQDGCLDVIDGQQRLTTIYLILCCLSDMGNTKLPYNPNESLSDGLYKLSYKSRRDDFFQQKLFANQTSQSTDNIDFYFMTKAYEIIKEWFTCHSSCQSEVLKLLLPDEYIHKDETEGCSSNDEDEYNSLLHDVRFIWYKTPAQSSIQTFNNLNYGKIGLTASELVKALLFECDRFEFSKRDIEKANAFTRSTKWTSMEESLQDKFFWGMLAPEHESKDLHLELILSFVATDIDNKQKYSIAEGWNREDADWAFNIFSKAIADNALKDNKGNDLKSTNQRVDFLWNEIQKIYTVFRNWFDDRTLYHRIGLYIFLAVHYLNIKHEDVIREFYELYVSNLKCDFSKELQKKIGDAVRIMTTTKDSKTDASGNTIEITRRKKLDEIKYGEDDDAIRKILLLFNVEVTLQNSQNESRFPFHLASKTKFNLNSLEHIHPQHLDNDDIEYADAKKWFDEKTVILENKYNLSDPTELNLKNAIANLKTNLIDEKTFLAQKSACLQDLEIIDGKFDELAGMDVKVMHSIKNLALVDGPTNAALGNNLMDVKRQILTDRTSTLATYVPLGTWFVFNKYFSHEVKDLQFWTNVDREAYFEQVEKIYNMFA